MTERSLEQGGDWGKWSSSCEGYGALDKELARAVQYSRVLDIFKNCLERAITMRLELID
jgi:hypothetical protein